jgi:fermentation-respiration switch protein FrsA (DUF1100 family)
MAQAIKDDRCAATCIMAAARCPAIRWVVADCAFATLERALDSAFEAFVHVPGPLFARPVTWFAQLFTGAQVTAVKPVECIGALAPRPVLLVHACDDCLVLPQESELLYQAAGEPKELWLIRECDHVQCRYVAQEYYERLDTFFSRPSATQRAPAPAGSANREDTVGAEV